MELVVNKKDNKVFTFDGSLGPCVWEPTPVTRFKFKTPTENAWIKKRLEANYPTCGIVYAGIPYIGTSDGFVATPNETVQRIPNVHVDSELFIEEYPFANDAEREAIKEFRKQNYDAVISLYSKDRGLLHKLFDIDKLVIEVACQEREVDRYLSEHFGRLSIRGFVVDRVAEGMETLYDGHLLGITETQTGEIVNELAPQAMYQISSTRAGFVPVDSKKRSIHEGIIGEIPSPCVDYHSLWSLDGKRMIVDGICPRDGSGGNAAMFATDGRMPGGVTAISHGNHPCYVLDIKVNKNNRRINEKRIDLNPHDLPQKLFVKEGQVYAFYRNCVVNHSEPNCDVNFTEEISSVADSGLCALIEDGKTLIANPFNLSGIGSSKYASVLEGEYDFLPSALQ